MIKNSRMLIDESPLTFQPSLATAIGLNGAIFLQQLQYWIKGAEKRGDGKYFFEGRWWIYNSYPEWVRNNFPFWSVRTLERIVDFLEHELHVVLSRADPALAGRKWYTIDYDALERLDILPAAFEPEPVEVESPAPERPGEPVAVFQSASAAPHVRGRNHLSGYRKPRQNGQPRPRQSDEGGLVNLTRGASSICRGGPRQSDEGSTRRLKGTLTETTTETSTERQPAGFQEPAGAPPLIPPVRRTGLVSLTLPAERKFSPVNSFAAEPDLWRERIQTWRASRKLEER